MQSSLIRQVSANLPKVWASPHIAGDRMWVTVYLYGSEERLVRIGETLAAAGWQNTGAADSG